MRKRRKVDTNVPRKEDRQKTGNEKATTENRRKRKRESDKTEQKKKEKRKRQNRRKRKRESDKTEQKKKETKEGGKNYKMTDIKHSKKEGENNKVGRGEKWGEVERRDMLKLVSVLKAAKSP